MLLRDFDQTGEIAGHADLVHTKNRPGLRANGCLNQGRVDVVGLRVDINEDGKSPAIAHTVGGCNIGVADSNHFIAKTHSRGK